MTTKILASTYNDGYTLSAAYSGVRVLHSAVVDGAAGAHGGNGGVGLYIGHSASIQNIGHVAGGAGGAGAGGAGGVGLACLAIVHVSNYGDISGGQGGAGGPGAPDGVAGDGIVLAAGGYVFNNATRYHAPPGTIAGYVGLYAGPSAATLVENYGTITGWSGVAVEFKSSRDVLIAEAYSTIIGIAEGGGGSLDLRGSTTVTGLGGIGTVTGSENMTFADFGSYSGVGLLVGTNILAAGKTLSGATLEGSLTNYGVTGSLALVFGELKNYGATGSVFMSNQGSIVNGSRSKTSAVINGIRMNAGTVTNFGTIRSGIAVQYGGAGASTVINFGTIDGGSNNSVYFATFGNRLIAEAGSTFIGAVKGPGTLELGGGAGTISNGGGTSALTGAIALTWRGFNYLVVDAGASWTTTGALAISKTVTVAGSLANLGAIANGGDGVVLTAGGSLDNAAATSLTKGIVGVYADATGGASVTNFGVIEGAGGVSVEFLSTSDRLIAEAGSSFIGAIEGGGGTLELGRGAGTISGLGGAGTLSGGVTASFSGFGSYVIDAGADWTIAGAAALAAHQRLIDKGDLTIKGGTIANAGLLEAESGTLVVESKVTGAGSAIIDNGTMAFMSSFSQDVSFTGSKGKLELARSADYAATISGFSRQGKTSLDLLDIGFVGVGEATFSGTKTSGVLTVTDGVHTARITLAGNYRGSTFVASSDGQGGTSVMTTVGGQLTAAGFVAAMAGMAAPASLSVHAGESWVGREAMLASGHVRMA